MGVLGDGLLPILEQSADVCLPDNSFGEEGVHRSIGQKQKHRIVRLAFIGPTSQDANSGTDSLIGVHSFCDLHSTCSSVLV